MADSDSRTVWCGNLSDQVTEELLYELFLQAAPLERVRIPTDKDGKKMNYGFITFKHEISIEYALRLLNGTRLFDKHLNIKYRNNRNPNELNVSRNDLKSLNQLPNISELIGRNSPNNQQRQWNNKYSEQSNRYRDRHSPYERNSYHDNRNDSSNRRRGDYQRDYSDRRNNRSRY